MPFVVSFLSSARTPEFVRSVTVKAAQRGADSFTLALAQKYRKDPAAKPLWAEMGTPPQRGVRGGGTEAGCQRAKVAAKEAERARKEAEKRRQRCDYQGLKDATGARPELFRALFRHLDEGQRRLSEDVRAPTRSPSVTAAPGRSSSGDTAQGHPAAILDNVLSRAPLHAACHGFREGHSTSTNAAPHVGHDVVVNLDLRDFFPTLTSGRVAGLFEQLDVPGGVRPAASWSTQ